MSIYEFNPIENISTKDSLVMLTTKYRYGDHTYDVKNHIIDNKFMKFGAFLYDEKDIKHVLNLDRDELTLFELKSVRTTTDVSMWEQTIRFDIIIPPPMIRDKQLGIYNLTSRCILHPKILIINDELLVCFLVDDIIKSRAKKIKKMMNKENVTT